MTGPGIWVLQSFTEQYGLPEPVYVVPVLVGLLGGIGILYLLDPPVTDWTIPALSPWVAAAAAAHVLTWQPVATEPVVKLFSTPMLYFTTGLILVVVWSISELIAGARSERASSDRQIGVLGSVVVLVVVGVSLWNGTNNGTLQPLWPVLGFFGAATLAGLLWVLVSLLFTETAASTGKTGVAVLFAHVLDGVSLFVNNDVVVSDAGRLSMDVMTPLTRSILEVGPRVPVVEGGVVFLVVKILVTVVLLVLFKRFVDYSTERARLALGFVAAVGLGTGLHNVLMMTVIESVKAAPA